MTWFQSYMALSLSDISREATNSLMVTFYREAIRDQALKGSVKRCV